jgi:hypothetical protein
MIDHVPLHEVVFFMIRHDGIAGHRLVGPWRQRALACSIFARNTTVA